MTVPSETSRRHLEPLAVQFSVFLPNRVGQLTDLLGLLAQNLLSVLGISIVDSTDWAVIRLVVSDSQAARQVFQTNQTAFTESQVLLVQLEDASAVQEVCVILLRGEINVHFAYPLMLCRQSQPVIVLHVDDPILASHLLLRHGMTLLTEADLSAGGSD